MKRIGLVVSLIFASCTVGPTVPKGELTVQGKGAEALTNEGDPMLNSGLDGRAVPIEFAKGYTKGVSDQVKRMYWARQEAQKTADEDLEGRTRYYNATIPQHEDSEGVIRVQREVIIPIVE
ncbi:MAG: hypothetical protein JO232_22570 [Verrucomicrobia bacterium]|jgi:hypothetical protein|nr:hypothetical protein [Verrucomicrobiota bacterium]